jgi:hypothetical protein
MQLLNLWFSDISVIIPKYTYLPLCPLLWSIYFHCLVNTEILMNLITRTWNSYIVLKYNSRIYLSSFQVSRNAFSTKRFPDANVLISYNSRSPSIKCPIRKIGWFPELSARYEPRLKLAANIESTDTWCCSQLKIGWCSASRHPE